MHGQPNTKDAALYIICLVVLTVNLYNNEKYAVATRLNNSQKSVKEMYILRVFLSNGTYQIQSKFFMFMVPYISVIYIYSVRLKVRDAHGFFMYSILHYTCSTCFGCFLHPSSEAQTAEYSRRYEWSLWCVGRWMRHWTLQLSTHHNNHAYIQLFVLLMMGANSTRNMYSKYSVIKNT
jgi:hypothetical protein